MSSGVRVSSTTRSSVNTAISSPRLEHQRVRGVLAQASASPAQGAVKGAPPRHASACGRDGAEVLLAATGASSRQTSVANVPALDSDAERAVAEEASACDARRLPNPSAQYRAPGIQPLRVRLDGLVVAAHAETVTIEVRQGLHRLKAATQHLDRDTAKGGRR